MKGLQFIDTNRDNIYRGLTINRGYTYTMSSKNCKNRLQEYCQQRKLPLPIYDAYRIDINGDNKPFRCDAILINENGTHINGVGFGKRIKESEKDAARHILTILEKHQRSNIVHISNAYLKESQRYVAIYLDMENINVKHLSELFKLNRYDPNQFLFIGCLSTGHHYAQTTFNFDGISFQKVLVPSTRSDAADIGMIMHSIVNHPQKAIKIIFVSTK